MIHRFWHYAQSICVVIVFCILIPSPPPPLQTVSPPAYLSGASQDTTPVATHNLTYHGGPVMFGSISVYVIFWEPVGSIVSPRYNSLILRYFRDVGGSDLYHNLVQYTDSKNKFTDMSLLAGYWKDTTAYATNSITDEQVHQEISRAMSVNGWHASLNALFFVFTARNENICIGKQCSFKDFCAYHNHYGTDTIYAAIPYIGTDMKDCGLTNGPNNDLDADSTINSISHEQFEAITDPLFTSWYDADGKEMDDKCAWMFGPLNEEGGDVNWNGHSYMLQEAWTNVHQQCEMQGP